MHGPKQFENLTASELHCPRCGRLQPVRERLLLVLPHGEIHAYRCVTCGETLGTREIRASPPGVPTVSPDLLRTHPRALDPNREPLNPEP